MRLRVYLVLCIQIAIIVFPFSIFAQTTPIPNQFENKSNVKSGRIIKCLQNKLDESGTSTSPDLYNFPSNGVPPTITKELRGTFIPYATIYAVACLPSTNGSVCSTGNRENDNYLFYGEDATINTSGINLNIDVAKIRANQDAYLSQVKVVFSKDSKESSKIKADSQGIVDLTAVITRQSASTPGNYSFFGIEIIDSIPVGSGDLGGVQQGMVGFETPDHGGTCARITWTVQPANPPAAVGQNPDPYGVIFDSQSLEPLPDVKITILNRNKIPLIDGTYPGFINGISTREDGAYSYIIEPGTYFFQIQPPAGFSFKADPSLHQNAKILYEYDDKISSSVTVKCSFYAPNESVKEEIDTDSERMKTNPAPDPECRNIPIESSSTPYTTSPKSMYYSLIRNSLNYILEGKISHPRSLIELSQGSKKIASMRTGTAGYYIISFLVTSVDQSQPITVTLTKPNYLQIPLITQLPKSFERIINTLYSFIVLNVFASENNSSAFQLDPIPAYIEGYAYNKNRQIVPNEVIQLRLLGKDSVYYQTKSDPQGYFIIPNNAIPNILPYVIEVVNPVTKEATQYKTYEFAQINKTYLATNKVNLINGTKNNKKVILSETNNTKTIQSSGTESTNSSLKPRTGASGINQLNTVPQTPTPPPFTKLNSVLPLIFILIFLVLMASGIAFFIIIKNKKSNITSM